MVPDSDKPSCGSRTRAPRERLDLRHRTTLSTQAHAAFIVDDVRGLADAVAAAGFAVNDDEPLDGYDRVYVADPFGNRIELVQSNA